MNLVKTIVAFAGATALAGSIASAQTMRASCDNRSGSTFADVTDSSDPTQTDYNVDPSEIFRTFSGISYPVNQSNAGNSAAANLTVNSRFLGSNPGSRITGFIASSSGTASATRSNMQVRARSSDRQAICFDVSGASVATPLLIRLRGELTLTGGTTGQVRLRNPSNTDLINITGGAINRVVAITANGTYSLDATFDTGMISINSGAGTQSRSGGVNASVTCIADYNGSGTITVQDIFDFLGGYFGGSPASDSNANRSLSVQDLFDFLGVYFGGCV